VVNFLGVPLSDALKMTSANPARVIGFGHSKGALEEGKDADIVILDEDLNVRNTIVRGRIITGI
jgi:N-acetylglucosamine-6-phosphate deacetylase